jgi:hypothetical protein
MGDSIFALREYFLSERLSYREKWLRSESQTRTFTIEDRISDIYVADFLNTAVTQISTPSPLT